MLCLYLDLCVSEIYLLFALGLLVISMIRMNSYSLRNQSKFTDPTPKKHSYNKNYNPNVVTEKFGKKKLDGIVCVKFQGRLGNSMFQYVFLYLIAKLKHLYPILPENSELFHIFEIEKTTLSAIKKPLNACSKLPEYKERWSTSYDEQLLKVPSNKSARFVGYFLSWKYWLDYEDEIRKLLTFRDFIVQKAHAQMRNITSKMEFDITNESVIVSIHIRRGDFASSVYINYGHLSPNETYYRNAMKYFKSRHKKVLFVVGSNDIDWSRKALDGEKNVYFSTGNAAAEDIALLSLANHTIISIGTYGWWIGWMAQGTCVYYKNAMRPGSRFANNVRTHSLDDFIYPGWIPVE